jgi:GntR family transcriptional regulator/MocR family aminotransferase
MWAGDFAITLQRRSGRGAQPYHRQVFDQIRNAILDRRLRPGDRLPSTRDCAAMLGLARNTVARAYEDLLVAGYLEGKRGAGTFVSAGPVAPDPDSRPASRKAASVSAPGGQALPAPPLAGRERAEGLTTGFLPYDFRPGIPDWDAFPRTLWLRLMGRAMRRRAPDLSRYGGPAGHLPLRRAIARHLAVSRGVSASPQQVVIVSGSQQALDLIARLRVRPGDRVALEDPGYPEARRVLAGDTARAVPIGVDDEGIVVPALERACRRGSAPRLLYVTPSHQFPTGVTLSLARRFALLEWAARRDVLIVEDDYDSEFRLPGLTVESLQGLDRSQRTVYVGTFSTVLFPPLRVGYVVLPPGLVEPFVRLKWLADRQTPTLEQLALTDFLEEGHFERHLRRMRRLVAGRRAALRAAVEEHMGEWIEMSPPTAGMHLMLRLKLARSGASARDVERRVESAALSRGVGVYPVGPCWARSAGSAALLLGYAALPEERIEKGIRLLAGIVPAAARGRR